jgi:hypothetical protein
MGNKWTGQYLNAHTNLSEIDLALDLLWRNDIKKDMVVMGLAFYGRAYTVNPACTTPGCLYLSGGLKGECSREVGVLLNDEIDQILEDKGAQPTLDKFTCDDGINVADIQFYRPAYPSSGDWDSADSITDEAIDNQDPACTNTNVRLKNTDHDKFKKLQQ